MRTWTLIVGLLMAGCDDDKTDAPPESITDTAADTTDTTDTTTDTADTTEADLGPTGLEGYCERYKECGGTYYPTAEDCVEASLNYWGDCPQMQAALDAFGDCMMTIDCDDYNPDTYNPANTDCAAEWQGVYDADC